MATGAARHSRVTWALGYEIVHGQRAQNEILPGDAELMSRFGVSRTVIREALKSLAAKGLVKAKARVGTRVLPRASWNMFDPDVLGWLLASGPDRELLRGLTEIRLAIEPAAAMHAAERRTEAQANEILAAVEAMQAARESIDAFTQRDLLFHHAVADASGNPFMRSISALVDVALRATFTRSSPVHNSRAFSSVIAVHRDIALAIRDGRGEDAAQSMREAINQGFRRAMRAAPEGESGASGVAGGQRPAAATTWR